MDAIIQQFSHLNIDGKRNKFVAQEQHALVPYHKGNARGYAEQSALVVYGNNGTMIPFDDPFNYIKKRRPRPKVDLDDETNRVWKLLLENINNDGIDGIDEEKVKWWEDQREVFRGRADSFIARMRLVQGIQTWIMYLVADALPNHCQNLRCNCCNSLIAAIKRYIN